MPHIFGFLFFIGTLRTTFVKDNTTNMPKLVGPPTNPMDNSEITQSGITKLLSELNADKAPGPDELPNLLLKNAAKEISPFLTDIFEHSIRTGKLPDEWVEANVAPVFKNLLDMCLCQIARTHYLQEHYDPLYQKQNSKSCATRFPCRALL